MLFSSFTLKSEFFSYIAGYNYITPQWNRKMTDKKQYQLEYVVKSSPKMLYNFISTPSGLSEWFADDVNFRGEIYTFIWDDIEEQAKLISKKSGSHLKLKWLNSDGDDTYFELRIQIDDLTKDVSLIITDFAEEDEIEESKMLWDSQINDLLSTVGS